MTISIDEDTFELLKRYAGDRSLSVGKALSELVRKGAAYKLGIRQVDGIHMADLPSDSPKVSTQHILDLEDEL